LWDGLDIGLAREMFGCTAGVERSVSLDITLELMKRSSVELM